MTDDRWFAGRPVWVVSVAAFVVAAFATEVYGILARLAGVPMKAGEAGGGTDVGAIAVGMFAMATMLMAFVATILAVLLGRYARSPGRTYLRTTLVLAVLSPVAPLTAGDTALSTKVMLCGAHLVAAVIVIPVVTRRLGEVRDD